MKNLKAIVICIFLINFGSLHAQKQELGKVTIPELEEKTHPTDPSAEAAFLFKKGEVRYEYSQSDGFVMKTEVMVKIKIYTKDGYLWANQTVPYYIMGSMKENLAFSDVCTYNLVDGKIVKSKMKSEGAFDEKVNKYWSRKKITLPNVKEGSIIEYSYVVTSPNIGKLMDWDFQYSIPVNYSEFKTFVPEYFIYNANQKGFIFPKTTVAKVDREVSYRYREDVTTSGSVVNSASNEKLSYIETQTTYFASNLPAMKDEVYVNNIDNYKSSISHELSIVRYPNVPLKTYSTDWETVAKKIYENEDFGSELNYRNYFETDITALTKGLTSREDVVSAVFDYVKKTMRWNGFYDYYCHDGVKQAYKSKTGNVAEINLMLTAMLRFAGVSANPLLVSTRSNGIALFPNRTAFNYVIVAVEIEDGLILLDATEKYALPNILPVRDLNWFGRLIREGGSSAEVDLMPKLLSKRVHNIAYGITESGTIEGKIRKQLTDYEALDFRISKLNLTKESYLEDLENKHNALEISDYVRENDQEISKPVIESYNFKDNGDVEIINGKMYISPMLYLVGRENPFKLEKREFPIDFSYPFQEKYLINIDIPKGYAVESLPKAVNMVTGDDIGVFKYLISSEGDKIQISVTFEIKTPIVSTDYYEVIKDFYQKVVDKENEKIVFVKL